MKRLYTGFEGPWTNQNSDIYQLQFPMEYLRDIEPDILKFAGANGTSSARHGGEISLLDDGIGAIRYFYDAYAPTVYSLSSYPIKKGSAIARTTPSGSCGFTFPVSAFPHGFYASIKCNNNLGAASNAIQVAFRVQKAPATNTTKRISIATSSNLRTMFLTKGSTVLEDISIPELIEGGTSGAYRGQDFTFNCYVKPNGEFYGEIDGNVVYYNFGWNPLSGTGPDYIYIGGFINGGAIGSGRSRIDDLMINDPLVKAFFTDLGGTGYGATGYAVLSTGVSGTFVDYLSVTDGGTAYTGPVRVTLDLESFTLPFSASDPSIASGIIQNDVTILSAGLDIVGKDTGLPNPHLRGYNWAQQPKNFYRAGFEESGSTVVGDPSKAVHDNDPDTRATSYGINDEIGYELSHQLLSGMSTEQNLGPVNMFIGGISENDDPGRKLTARLGVSGSSPLLSAASVDLPNPLHKQGISFTHDKYNRSFPPNSLSALQATIRVQ